MGSARCYLGPMYVTDRQTDRRQADVRRASSINVPTLGAGRNKITTKSQQNSKTAKRLATTP